MSTINDTSQTEKTFEPPKLFISYSWSTPEHEQAVIDLATEIRESGVDVILDKWRLKEGHDAIAFMEQMVSDPDVKKVVMICDKTYAEKADGRAGGVGTETQIISPEIYKNQSQDKFVAVVFEKDEQGKSYLPTYYKSRIYIDLSEPDRYASEFEKLLRWIFNKPLYVEPEIGKPPAFLSEKDTITLGTTAIFKRVTDALRNDKSYASGALEEYLGVFAENLEKFRIADVEGEFDDAVIQSIESFTPYRNEFIQLVTVISQYMPTEENLRRLHSFFENLIPYLQRPINFSGTYREWDFDNFKFIVHELFLYTIAILIVGERFQQVNYLLEQGYYNRSTRSGLAELENYTVLQGHLKSLEYRNSRLKMNRISIHADLLHDRCKGIGLDFYRLAQADFVLYLRKELVPRSGFGGQWWPHTLVYVERLHSAFEIFSRMASKSYFERAKIILGIVDAQPLNQLVEAISNGQRRAPSQSMFFTGLSHLMGLEKIETLP